MKTITVSARNKKEYKFSVFTFKDPSNYGFEEADGKPIFVVEENDGLFNTRHTYNRENIICITEKKHKS